MNDFLTLFAFFAGLALGGLGVWLVLRARLASQAHLADMFKALAADTLHANSATFLQIAEGKLQQKSQSIDAMLKPVQDTLQKMDAQLRALEVKREGAYRELAQLVSSSQETQNLLRNETSQLLQALRAPTSRGAWGELQLQRILEMTGMSKHAHDFQTQETVTDADGTIRPDVIVALPGDRCVIIDSKVPLTAYLDSVQTNDEAARAEALRQHARHLKDHIKKLGNKAYWDKIEGAPEFVVLFLPGEHFLSAALDGDGGLMEYSAQNQVVLATPMTLIALLRTVAYGWRQESLRANMREIADLGRKLHGALATFAGHMENVGSRLGGAVESYNRAVKSLETGVLNKARALSDYGAGANVGEKEIAAPEIIEREPRLVVVSGHEEETAKKAKIVP